MWRQGEEEIKTILSLLFLRKGGPHGTSHFRIRGYLQVYDISPEELLRLWGFGALSPASQITVCSDTG